MLQIEILTIFPQIFESFCSTSLVEKAINKKLLNIKTVNIRDFADAPHFKVDDLPYSGGAGMVMKPEPLARAIADSKARLPQAPVVLLSAAGKLFKQNIAQDLSKLNQLILICGRYEGVDQRICDHFVDLELSIGDYVLMGGEIPAMAIIEAVARLRPEIIGNSESLTEESFHSSQGDEQQGSTLLEAPQYTRPAEFNNLQVPEILLSGDGRKIAAWKKEQALARTAKNRPDLLEK